jgi:hypothetical protein
MGYSKLIIVVLLLTLVFGGALDWDEYTKSFEERYDVSPGCELVVSIGDGDLEIEGWQNDEIQIEAKMTAWASSKKEAEEMFERLNIRKRGQRVSVTYKSRRLPRAETRVQCDGVVVRRGSRVDCKIFLPEEADLDFDLDDGVVSIEGIEGKVIIDGDDIDVISERVKADKFEIDSDDGDIEIVDFDGNVKISSDDTNVLLKEVTSPSLYISTDDGSINAETTIETEGKYEFKTDDGDITLAIPDGAAARISVRKDDGRFESELPILLQGSMGTHHIQGVIARDEAAIYISTDDGDITIKKRTKE